MMSQTQSPQVPPSRVMVAGLLMIFMVTGCESFGGGGNLTPEVRGRVLAADSHQPLAGVRVQPVVSGQEPNLLNPTKGAQLLQQSRPVVTDDEGAFVYPGRSSLTFFRRAGGGSVQLAFQLAGYSRFQTNFDSFSDRTTSDSKIPVVQAGDILLRSLHP